MTIPKATKNKIKGLVKKYVDNKHIFDSTASSLATEFNNNPQLQKLIHSLKFRSKDPDHLEEKLKRKYLESKKSKTGFAITEENLFSKVSDLAGVRIIHLHTQQTKEIIHSVELVLAELKFKIVEKLAYSWDEEHKQYFDSLGFKVSAKDTMYTSIHYVVQLNRTTSARCEIQIRTLMEEVWGEVSHIINYPEETQSIACKEQLKALAKVASGGGRLVDSIFASKLEFDSK